MNNFMQDENFISNKENLNGYEDIMDEPMDIDPSTPFANKIRQTNIRQEEQKNLETTDSLTNEITQRTGPKIVKPVKIRPNVANPKTIKVGLPVPQFPEDDEFANIDPFKTKSKIALDATEFQTPGGFNLRLSDETMNEDMKSFTEEENPFATKSKMLNSPVRKTPPKTHLFKSPPPPPMFSNSEDLNSNIEELNNSTHSQQNGEANELNDEWETHKKRSTSSRSLNNSLSSKAKSPTIKQSGSLVSSNTDISSENLTASPPMQNKNNILGLSTSSSESASEPTSVYSSNTASTSSMNNNNIKTNDICENEINENFQEKLDLTPSKEVFTKPAPEQNINEIPKPEDDAQKTNDTPIEEPNQVNLNEEEVILEQPEPESTIENPATSIEQDLKTSTELRRSLDEEINDDTLMKLKNSNFVGSTRNDNTDLSNGPNVFEEKLLDFGDDNNLTNDVANNENDKNVENVVFDSIFSNDNDFNSFLDLLEKKEVDNSIKNSPKYSEFARKSLYLQFDPITQLNLSSSLSPEKVKRLSIIVDKQKAIKNYLSEFGTPTIEEDESETANQNSSDVKQSETLVKEEPKVEESVIAAAEQILPINDLETENVLIDKEEKPISEMILTNETLNNTENFSKKLDLNEEDLPIKLNNNTNKQFEEEQRLYKESLKNLDDKSDLIIDSIESKKINEERISSDRNSISMNNSVLDLDRSTFKVPNVETSFKLLAEDSMMLDESQLLPIKKPTEKPKQAASLLNPKNLSTEDLSTSSACMSSASAAEVSRLTAEINELKEREKIHMERIDSLEDENEKFKRIAMDFEEIFQNLVKDKEEGEIKLKNEIIELTKERDHLQEDVCGVERAFDDLHRRFEKLKTKVEEFKRNEESLQNAIEVYKQQLDKEKCKYSTLKKHAEEKIEFANNEIEKVRKTSGVEIQRLSAELRKAEIKISSLDLSVQQKDNENSQLTNLLEDLLTKVKPNQ